MPKAKAAAKYRRKARKARLRRQQRPQIGAEGLQHLAEGPDGEAPWLARKRMAQHHRAERQRETVARQRRAA